MTPIYRNLVKLCQLETKGVFISYSKNVRCFTKLKDSYVNIRYFSSSKDFEDLDKPIKFTSSKAAQWSASKTHRGQLYEETPWYQPYVVCGSVGIFLLYFLVLREESDLDEAVGKPIWEHVQGMTPEQASQMIEVDKRMGLNTETSKEKLQEYSETISKSKSSP